MNSGSILSTPRYLKSLCIHAPTFTTSTITLNMPTRMDFHKQNGNTMVHLYDDIYSIGPVSAPEAAILRALGDVLMFLSCTDKPELLTLTQTLCLQLVL